jgi:hypothetical protein
LIRSERHKMHSGPRLQGLLRRALLCAGLVVLSGCPQQTALWIEPGSTAEHLVFGISNVRGGTTAIQITVLRIDRWDVQSGGYLLHWGYGAGGGIVPDGSTRIMYGVMPGDAEPLEGAPAEAPPLQEGCYLAYDTGTGRAVFLVDAAGRVFELAWSDCRDAFPVARVR